MHSLTELVDTLDWLKMKVNTSSGKSGAITIRSLFDEEPLNWCITTMAKIPSLLCNGSSSARPRLMAAYFSVRASRQVQWLATSSLPALRCKLVGTIWNVIYEAITGVSNTSFTHHSFEICGQLVTV